MMNMKYGVLINQNEELNERMKQKDEIVNILKSIIERNDRQKDLEILQLRQQLIQHENDWGKLQMLSTSSSGNWIQSGNKQSNS